MNTAMTPVMVLGCTSDAGKSFLVTAICRSLANRGFRVAPFKAQNMSNNAAVTADGLEIGRAQYVQALAARATPDVRMNPILLKPVGDMASHVVLLGEPAPDVSAMPWRDRPQRTWPVVRDALRSLRDEFEIVVIEGAGSPAEVNLRDVDIVNIGVLREARPHAYLCVDIDRGGAFAHLLGTWMCLEPDERSLLRGFVLNKFRGDPLLLGTAPRWLEERTGVATVAVVPWVEHGLPEEDRLVVRHTGASMSSSASAAVRIAVIGYPYASNVDEFDVLGWEDGVSVEVIRGQARLDHFDAVLLPGSRNSAASLRWLRSVRLDTEIAAAARRGALVLGVCGGLQILGRRIDDPHRIEGAAQGLGLLPIDTVLREAKLTTETSVRHVPTGFQVSGYEIRHGVTTADGGTPVLLDGDRGWIVGRVMGSYVHGLFDAVVFRQWFLGQLHWTGKCGDWQEAFDKELDRVAEHVERTGFIGKLLADCNPSSAP